MSNPMMQMLTNNKLGQAIAQTKSLMSQVQAMGNPQMSLAQMAGSNPMVAQAMQYVQQNGGDAQTAFYKLAQEKGVDPNTILQMF